jgi:hypothetical protein
MAVEFQVRKLVKGDEETLDAFLAPYTPFIYFMRSNIRKGGVVYEDKPYHADYFGAFANGELNGVIAHHWIGSIQVFIPEKSARATLAMAIAEHLSAYPRNVTIVLGPSEHVQDVCDTLGLTETDFRSGRNREYLYSLDLAEMKMPELLKNPDVLVRLATKEDLSILIPWDHDYLIETTKERPGPETLKKATDRITLRTEEGGLFVLEDKGRLTSYCGAHGALSDWKIVGPVWTSVDLRNRGYGRAVTAGSLAILRDKGASHAVLFTESLAAVKAYLALGFREIGEWRLDFLKEPIRSFKLSDNNVKPLYNVPAP